MDLNLTQLAGLDEGLTAQMAELFSTLLNTSRLPIIPALTVRRMNIGALADIVEISESTISHHMRQLRLVRTGKAGCYVFSVLNAQHVVDLFRYGLEHVQHG